MPDEHFSKDTFIRNMRAMVQQALADGYDSFRAVGDESFIVTSRAGKLELIMSGGPAADAMKPDVERVRTCSKRGFMT